MANTTETNMPGTKELEMELDESILRPTIGIAANHSQTSETRFMLTPESCGMLSDGYKIIMETKAAADLNYTDEDFVEYGVRIVTRKEALTADFVLSFHPLKPSEIKKMRQGAALICFSDNLLFDRDFISALAEKEITMICLDSIESHNGETVFANIIDEIDGRTSAFYAAEALSFLGHGRGTLLAGVAGTEPCRVLIIGVGNRVNYAAKTAIALGAQVTLMDNDVSALQLAQADCGERLVTCAIQPHVLTRKVSMADVVMLDSCTRSFEFPKKLSLAMKEDIYFLDFNETSPSKSVPRTVAMALSIPLINFFNEMEIKNGIDGQIALTPGVQSGVMTYHGQLVNKLIGSCLSLPSSDLRMMFTDPN